MNFETFRNGLEKELIFTIQEAKILFPGFDTKRLVEWQQKSYLHKLVNRWYYFPLFQQQNNAHFLAANSVYQPSYISLHSALSYYGLIPEIITSVTSLTTKINSRFSTQLGLFTFNHIKPSLMFGYHFLNFENPFMPKNAKSRQIKMADIEKAILDYFYIYASISTEKDIAEVRVDPDIFHKDVNQNKLNNYLSKFCNQALEKRISRLINIVTHG